MARDTSNIEALRANAALYWPSDLRAKVALISILPHLLKTQEFFISVLKLSGQSPEAWKTITEVTGDMPANLFLKHLMVLSDLGRETLSKIVPLTQFFPEGIMKYTWREAEYEYKFQHFILPAYEAPVTNTVLGILNSTLLAGKALTPAMEDIIMLLLHASTSIDGTLPEGYSVRCQIGPLIGEPELLEKFVKENYIRVSTQIRGQTANASGQVVQDYVKTQLKELLPTWQIKSGRIPGISHDDGETLTSFDVVAKSPSDLYFAIEVAFQETTNSVIERKAGQAPARQALLHAKGYKVCYVIDGIGNLNFRTKAVTSIIDHSDCTVAFTKPEVAKLAEYLKATESANNATGNGDVS